jgi:hypothetical protein
MMQSTAKNNKFTTGAKNKRVRARGCPASRSRFMVMLIPIQRKGRAVIKRMVRKYF